MLYLFVIIATISSQAQARSWWLGDTRTLGRTVLEPSNRTKVWADSSLWAQQNTATTTPPESRYVEHRYGLLLGSGAQQPVPLLSQLTVRGGIKAYGYRGVATEPESPLFLNTLESVRVRVLADLVYRTNLGLQVSLGACHHQHLTDSRGFESHARTLATKTSGFAATLPQVGVSQEIIGIRGGAYVRLGAESSVEHTTSNGDEELTRLQNQQQVPAEYGVIASIPWGSWVFDLDLALVTTEGRGEKSDLEQKIDDDFLRIVFAWTMNWDGWQVATRLHYATAAYAHNSFASVDSIGQGGLQTDMLWGWLNLGLQLLYGNERVSLAEYHSDFVIQGVGLRGGLQIAL